MATLVKCASCKREISSTARICPHCGDSDIKRRETDAFKKEWIGYLIVTLTIIGWFGRKNYEIIKFGFTKHKVISIFIAFLYIGTFSYLYFYSTEEAQQKYSFLQLTVFFLIVGQLVLIGIYELIKLINPQAILNHEGGEINSESNNQIDTSSEKTKTIIIGAIMTILIVLSIWFVNKNKISTPKDEIVVSEPSESKLEPTQKVNNTEENNKGENEEPAIQPNNNDVNENNIQTDSNNQKKISSNNNTNDYVDKYYLTNASDDNKVYFYNSPDLATRRKAFFNSRESVKLIKIKNNFGYVEFINDRGQESVGWIKMQDLIEKP